VASERACVRAHHKTNQPTVEGTQMYMQS